MADLQTPPLSPVWVKDSPTETELAYCNNSRPAVSCARLTDVWFPGIAPQMHRLLPPLPWAQAPFTLQAASSLQKPPDSPLSPRSGSGPLPGTVPASPELTGHGPSPAPLRAVGAFHLVCMSVSRIRSVSSLVFCTSSCWSCGRLPGRRRVCVWSGCVGARWRLRSV